MYNVYDTVTLGPTAMDNAYDTVTLGQTAICIMSMIL